MDDQLAQMLKYLRLNGLLNQWDETLAMARKSRLSPARLLSCVVEREYKLRRESARLHRLKRAGIPELLVMETFPFHDQPKLNRKAVLSIYDAFAYMPNAQNIIWLGPPGCGKTGLATAFLVDALNRGYTGRFVSFIDLLDQIRVAGAIRSETKAIKPYISCDCLLIDEIGYVEVEPSQVGLFLRLIQCRHKKRPTLITSNLGFDDWRPFFRNDQLVAALVDRLTENSHIINMKKCRSLRAGHRPNQ